jgi:prevent-host-death family protein
MTMVNIFEDKNKLVDLVNRVVGGERIILVTEGDPVAELVPYNEKKPTLKFGLMKGRIKISDDFDLLSDEVSELFQEYMPK